MGGSSSQPRTDPTMSPINAFPIGELYSPQFLDSFQDNTGYWQEPNPRESPVDQVATSPTKNKKKPSRNRQKMTIQSDDASRQTPWTTEEEIALAKGWLAVSENGKDGNAKKKQGFWCEESGTGDEDYVQKAMIHYEIETGVPFKLRHCWEILKDRPKWQEIALLKFQQGLGVARDTSHLVPVRSTQKDRDKARAAGRKNKGSKPAGSSTLNEDEMAREVECRERELEQQDMRYYLQPYDHLTGDQRKAMDEIKAKIKAKYNLQY
ncbi:ribonuclease H-like domain-containing protein [Tanacetum coccineum]